jgi:PPIC-type PPIASE domain
MMGTITTTGRRIRREPLLHFFVLGGVLFLLFAWANRSGFQAPDEIVIDSTRIDVLRSQFERVWQRLPTQEELEGLVEDYVREEILYREGIAIGLDRDDPVLRRRVAQKMQFISVGFASSVVTEAELQGWLDNNMDAYRIEPGISFHHVFFDPTRHQDSLSALLAEVRVKLRDGIPSMSLGDSTLLPPSLTETPLPEVRRIFGAQFAESLPDLPVGEWSGPIVSGYGVHFVYVDATTPGRTPALAEVRAAVERDFLADRNQKASDAFYETLRKRYTIMYADGVTVAGSAVQAAQ